MLRNQQFRLSSPDASYQSSDANPWRVGERVSVDDNYIADSTLNPLHRVNTDLMGDPDIVNMFNMFKKSYSLEHFSTMSCETSGKAYKEENCEDDDDVNSWVNIIFNVGVLLMVLLFIFANIQFDC